MDGNMNNNNQGYGTPDYNQGYTGQNYGPDYSQGYGVPDYNQGYTGQNYGQGYAIPDYNQGYTGPDYNQGYVTPDYNQGYNNYNAAYNNTTPAYYTGYQDYQVKPVRCPGKEIVGLVFGINALVWGVLALLFCWHPMIGTIYALSAIAYSVVTFVMDKQIGEKAEEISSKIIYGKRMAIAGMIIGIVAIGITVVIVLVFGVAVVGSLMSSFSNLGTP